MKKKVKNPIYVMKYVERKDTLLLVYRSEIIHCIRQYWSDEILNLNTQKKWEKYLEKVIEDKSVNVK